MLKQQPAINTIQLTNFLSYGETSEPTKLEALNVLIGPNSSGKSNLLEALGILSAAPTDLMKPIREGGVVSDWLSKTARDTPTATLNVTLKNPISPAHLRYKLSFTESGERFELVDEAIENEFKDNGNDQDVHFYYRYQRGQPVVNTQKPIYMPGVVGSIFERKLDGESLKHDQSVLSQLRDPDQYPELAYVGELFSSLRLYREWSLGRDVPARRPARADMPGRFLEEDASNLGLVLNDLQHQSAAHAKVLEKLRDFNDAIVNITTKVEFGTVQIFLHERGLRQPIPATRLSDGTLRYICLLTLLCHPKPPPVLCIEEPELGLHPDILPGIAELLIEASQRTQLIVTTHSDVLVSALTDVPECVLVCSRDASGTRLERLDKATLAEWLKKYTLGELWRMGEIGGTPW